MSNSLLRQSEKFPALIDEVIAPWNNWFRSTPFFSNALKMPAVNITESPSEYKIAVAAPGLSKSDFKIDLSDDSLTVSCEKEDSKEEKDANYTRREYSFTSFSRRFDLPDDVKKDKIDAQYHDGILSLMLPRNENQKKNGMPKHIPVR